MDAMSHQAMPPAVIPDVAVFIDWENLRFSLWERRIVPNLSLLSDAVKAFGRVVVARAYADWLHDFFLKNLDQTVLYHAGIEPVFVPTWDPERQRRRKNSVDVKMSADCMEICYANPNITRYILITGDADFLHVANSLRRMGREVIVVGVSWSTSQRIIGQVDDLLYYDRDIDDSHTLPRAMTGVSTSRETDPELKKAISALVDLVNQQRALDKYPTLAWLGSQIRRVAPGFRHEDYKFSKFKSFVLYARDQGLLQVATSEMTDWAFLPGEAPPTTAGRKPQDLSRPSCDSLWSSDVPLEDFADDFRFVLWGVYQLDSAARAEPLTIDLLADHLHHWVNATDDVIPHGLRGLDRPSLLALVERSLTLGLLTFKEGAAPAIALNPASALVAEFLDVAADLSA